MSTIESTIAGGVGLTDTQSTQLTAIYNEVVQHVGDMVLLWTNSSPTSSFAAQTVTISGGFSSYKYLVIECYQDANHVSDDHMDTEYNLRSTSATETFYIAAGGNHYRTTTINKSAGH